MRQHRQEFGLRKKFLVKLIMKEKIYTMKYQSPLGEVLVASDGENITGLWLEGQKYFLSTMDDILIEKEDLPVFIAVKKWLTQYFAGKNPDISPIPLAPRGSEFRQMVWKILLSIPYGKTTTYGNIAKEVAKQMGREKMSAQAVGGAVGHNPISIIIPCHRVIGTDGSLTGYAGGIEKKEWLLRLEGVIPVV